MFEFNPFAHFFDKPQAIRKAVDFLPVNATPALISQALKEKGYPGRTIPDKVISKIARTLKELKRPENAESLDPRSSMRHLVRTCEEILKVHDISYDPRLPENRTGACGYYSSVGAVIAEQLGLQPDIYQVRDLNDQRGASHSYGHAFNIITHPDGPKFLMDLTRVQFDRMDGSMLGFDYVNERNQIIPIPNSHHIADFPSIQALHEEGFFELTEQTLQEYLNASSLPRSDALHFPIELLGKATPLLLQNERSKILGYLNQLE